MKRSSRVVALFAPLAAAACDPDPIGARVRDTGAVVADDATIDPGPITGDDAAVDAITEDGNADAAIDDAVMVVVPDSALIGGRERTGYIRAQQLPGVDGRARGEAAFIEWSFDPDAGTAACEHRASLDDACAIERCPATGRYRNAGAIMLAGDGTRLLLGGDPVTHRYDDAIDDTVQFTAGSMVAVTASGGDVGGFETDPVPFPAAAMLALPVRPSGTAHLALDRTQPFSLQISTPRADDTLFARITQSPGVAQSDGSLVADPTQGRLTIDCTWLVLDDTTFTVSPDVLATLDGDGVTHVTLGTRTENTPLTAGGGWTVRVQYENVALDADVDLR